MSVKRVPNISQGHIFAQPANTWTLKLTVTQIPSYPDMILQVSLLICILIVIHLLGRDEKENIEKQVRNKEEK